MSGRRRTVVDQTAGLTRAVKDVEASLRDLWDEVGFLEADREHRTAELYGHLHRLLEQMVEEEQTMVKDLREERDGLDQRRTALAAGLGLPLEPLAVPENGGILASARLIKESVQTLESIRSERLRRARELELVGAELAEALGTAAPVPFDEAAVPSLSALRELEAANAGQALLLRQRRLRYQAGLERLALVSAHLPQESDIAQAMRGGEADPGLFPLTEENLTAMDAFLARMETEWAGFQSERRGRFEQARAEAVAWLDKCLVPEAQRPPLATTTAAALEASEGICGQADIASLLSTAAAWRSFYEERETVLGKAAEWEALWDEKLAWESRAPNDKYRNRGGDLEKELRRQRTIAVRLPGLEAELAKMVGEWRAAHPGQSLVLAGADPLEHIRSLRAAYATERSRSRAAKEAEHQAELAQASVFGTPERLRHRPGAYHGGGSGATFARSAAAAHFSPGRLLSTPLRTPTGLITASSSSPRLHAWRSAPKIAGPGSAAAHPYYRIRRVDSAMDLNSTAAKSPRAQKQLFPSAADRLLRPSKPLGQRNQQTRLGSAAVQEAPIYEEDFVAGAFVHSTLEEAEERH